jgi:hypothetical protein
MRKALVTLALIPIAGAVQAGDVLAKPRQLATTTVRTVASTYLPRGRHVLRGIVTVQETEITHALFIERIERGGEGTPDRLLKQTLVKVPKIPVGEISDLRWRKEVLHFTARDRRRRLLCQVTASDRGFGKVRCAPTRGGRPRKASD